MNTTLVIIGVSLLGVLSRTLIPFFEQLRVAPDTQFDRKFLLPPVVSCVIAILTLPLALQGLPAAVWQSKTLEAGTLILIWMACYGLTDLARTGQKLALR